MRMPAGNLADCIAVENDHQLEEMDYEPGGMGASFPGKRFWNGLRRAAL